MDCLENIKKSAKFSAISRIFAYELGYGDNLTSRETTHSNHGCIVADAQWNFW